MALRVDRRHPPSRRDHAAGGAARAHRRRGPPALTTDAVAGAVAHLRAAGGALLIDCEFTCWEESLRTGWADPTRPPELIEIGLAVYDVPTRTVGATFTTLVRPRVNPALSDYCVALLHIAQEDVDAADDLPAAMARVTEWLGAHATDGLPTCGWGTPDRTRIADNARRHGIADPLVSRPHIDLQPVMTAFLRAPAPVSREDVRARVTLPPNLRRHRALDDALDVANFLGLLAL